VFVIMVYDVGEKRVARALKVGRRYLSWVQNSVFEGELSPAVYQQLKADMRHVLDREYDSVIFYTWRTERYATREILGQERGSGDQFL
jgi:CRISPR-associated protein Cas2